MTAIDMDAFLAAIQQPGPIDDHGPDHEPDDYYPQREIDQRGDEAADAYEREMDASWEK